MIPTEKKREELQVEGVMCRSGEAERHGEVAGVTIQYNTIQSNLFQLSYMSIIIIIHCIFLNEKSKRICRKLNKLIRDIPRITHNQFT